MKAFTNILHTVKALAVTSIIMLGLTQCSEDEIISEESITEDMVTTATSTTDDVASISVTGLFTEFSEDIQCATCTYIVGPSDKVVDGKELGLQAGSVICLKKSVKYAAVEFVNLEGTQESPIKIGYCAN
jgi:hypothetical protein